MEGVLRFRGPREVIVNLRPGSHVFCFDRTRVFSIDACGRLLSAVDGDTYVRRSLANVFRRRTGTGPEQTLPPPDARAFVESVRAALADFSVELGRGAYSTELDEAVPAVREVLARDCAVGADTLAEDARWFRRIYGAVPILPPDQALALYVQAAVGCAWARCTFCSLYGESAYRVRDVEEFASHVQNVCAFFGPAIRMRRSIFLGDADAAGVPTPTLRRFIEILNEAFDIRPAHVAPRRWHWENPSGFDGVTCFGEPISVLRRDPPDWEALAGLGLRRVYVGVETGSAPLRNRLHKRGDPAECVEAVRRLRDAGIASGILLMSGLDDPDHVAQTAELVAQMGLVPGDMLFVSPRRPPELADDRAAEQHAEMKAALRGVCPTLPLALYDVSRFQY